MLLHGMVRNDLLPNVDEVKLPEVFLKRDAALASFLDSVGVALAQSGFRGFARKLWTEETNTKEGEKFAPLLNIGQSYLEDGDVEEAFDWFDLAKRATKRPAELALADFNGGVAYLDLRQFPDAVAAFSSCIARAPNWGMAYNNLGIAMMELGDRSGAREAFLKCLSLGRDTSPNLGDGKSEAASHLARLKR
jgi:tetratricopeptide (TPR) repeat protein